MNGPLMKGDRIVVTDPGDPHLGARGTVLIDEYPSPLTQRPMVEVLIDGQRPVKVEGFYVEQVDRLARLKAAS